MTEIVLFHHAQGLTDGVRAFADDLRSAGHVVHTPDVYDGRSFPVLDDGMAYLKEIGFDAANERCLQAAESLPAEVVYAGFSFGVMAAQQLAQTRPGARGALLMHAAVLPADLGGSWPSGLPLQVHTMEDDSWGDADVARQLDEEVPEAEVFLYPGSTHLFTDRSLPDHEPQAAALVLQRALAFLARL
jgi:dienelactone hydrolase